MNKDIEIKEIVIIIITNRDRFRNSANNFFLPRIIAHLLIFTPLAISFENLA